MSTCKERLQSILDVSSDPIQATLPNGQFIYTNQSWQKLLGYSSTDLEQCLFFDLVHPAHRDLCLEMFQVGQPDIVTSTLQSVLLTREGCEIEVTGTVSFQAQDDGSTGIWILWHLSDQAEVQDANSGRTTLDPNGQQLLQLAEVIRDVLYIHDIESYQLLYISPAFEQVWGLSLDKIYQDPYLWLANIYPSDRPSVAQAVERQLTGMASKLEYRIIRPDGELRWIESRSFPVRDAQGRIYRIAGIAQDITARKQTELALKRFSRDLERRIQECSVELGETRARLQAEITARQQIEAELQTREESLRHSNTLLEAQQETISHTLKQERELGDLRSRFVTVVSHEFRTPLTTIQSAAELLEYYDWSTEEKQERFQQIKGAVKHMTELLEDALLMGRIEAGKLQLQRQCLDLHALCREVLAELQVTISPRHRLHFQVQGQPYAGQLDGKLIRQMLINLLSNAIKYSPKGGPIGLSLFYSPDHTVLIQVQDEGIGIPLEDRDKLFQVFYRAMNVGTIQGTGIGLAIVKGCVEMHGGTVDLISEVGQGTTFTITLPLPPQNEPIIGQ
ncbi:hypothetical protein BST81_16320 [Leptolyngbya sp. 'hensonii']|uniref:sensor histidine kinase n=1 Tax=Leptolyngbya sp. 'hensonii' TaxID=1922337 RepID=UPI00094FC851|nr:PAS domain-containing sensor histidine kinase [Leptolyngbya sp. 'hensonii']OLP17364.1 hypothetical protein BST81_16320 [Leptolyngbya sp. 'hensonii']